MRATFKIVESFFDRKKVADAVSAARRNVLSKFGAFVRRRAQTSMRRSPRASSPGTPPNARVGHLRRFLFFAFDSASKSVVVGPVQLRKPTGVPGLHEYGGTVMRAAGKGGRRPAVYPSRQYMRPALAAEKAKLPPMFRNIIK